MLKIDFFPPDIVKEYENQIAEKIKVRNGGRDEIEFIPNMPQYKIYIHELLTAERSEIFKISGIQLYCQICSSQKYKSKSNVELLHTLKSEFPQVHEIKHDRGNYRYEIYSTKYCTTRINDTSPDNIITEAADLIKGKFAKYDLNYANHFFNVPIRSISDLNKVLKKMFNELKNKLNVCSKKLTGTQGYIIDYSILPSDLRHKLMNSIGIRTCPYCNRNYISSYGERGNKSTADLDHFYQKKQYPLFALSLFNFVPSCSVCNSRMKNTHPADDALYPYEEGFEDDAHFELKSTSRSFSAINTLHLFQAIKDTKYDDFNVEIVADPNTPYDKKEKIKKSIELFHLTEVYANHKRDALEAALRTRVYCEGSYKTYCEKLLMKLENSGMKMTASSDLDASMFEDFLDDEWLMFGIFFNDEKRRFDKPLSKMIYDIYKSGKK